MSLKRTFAATQTQRHPDIDALVALLDRHRSPGALLSGEDRGRFLELLAKIGVPIDARDIVPEMHVTQPELIDVAFVCYADITEDSESLAVVHQTVQAIADPLQRGLASTRPYRRVVLTLSVVHATDLMRQTHDKQYDVIVMMDAARWTGVLPEDQSGARLIDEVRGLLLHEISGIRGVMRQPCAVFLCFFVKDVGSSDTGQYSRAWDSLFTHLAPREFLLPPTFPMLTNNVASINDLASMPDTALVPASRMRMFRGPRDALALAKAMTAVLGPFVTLRETLRARWAVLSAVPPPARTQSGSSVGFPLAQPSPPRDAPPAPAPTTLADLASYDPLASPSRSDVGGGTVFSLRQLSAANYEEAEADEQLEAWRRSIKKKGRE